MARPKLGEERRRHITITLPPELLAEFTTAINGRVRARVIERLMRLFVDDPELQGRVISSTP